MKEFTCERRRALRKVNKQRWDGFLLIIMRGVVRFAAHASRKSHEYFHAAANRKQLLSASPPEEYILFMLFRLL